MKVVLIKLTAILSVNTINSNKDYLINNDR